MRTIPILITLALLLAACGVQNEAPDADSSDPPTSETTENPTTIPEDAEGFSLLLTDAPTDDAAWLRVDFGRIELVPAEGAETGVVTVSDDGGTIENLLELDNGATRTLEEDVDVPDGTYEQIRLVVEDVTIAFDGEGGVSTRPVKLPSGRLTIPVEPALVVEDGAASRVVLDFDAAKAVHAAGKSGKFILKPTAIRAVTVSGVLEGSVVDAGGAPVESATVEVHEGAYVEGGEPLVSARTEADGTYRIVTLLEGEYTVVASADGYEATTVEAVTISAHETTTLETVTLAEITTGALEGVAASEAADGTTTTLAGASVGVYEGAIEEGEAPVEQAVTGTDGAFAFDALAEADDYTVVIAAEGYEAATITDVTIVAGETTVLPEEVLVAVEATGTLAGTIESVEGAVLANAHVRVYEGAIEADDLPVDEAFADADGGFVIDALAEGAYTVVVEAEGFETETAFDVVVTADATTTLDVALAGVVEEAPVDEAPLDDAA